MPWKKGQSGNPKGKPKLLGPNGKTLREMAREHTAEMIETLVKIARSGDTDAARRAAASDMLDRGWGRPAQAVEVTGAEGGPIQTLDVTAAPEDVLRWIAGQSLDTVVDGETAH
jgi:hypothetical protein